MNDGAKIAIGILAAYFGFFVLILLDEEVFATDYLENALPESVKVVIRILYLPLIPFYEWIARMI